MSTPKIEKGIPLPRGWVRRQGMQTLLRAMEVGDSIAWPNPMNRELAQVQRNALSAAQAHRPKRFTCRMVEEKGKRVVRVWRVE